MSETNEIFTRNTHTEAQTIALARQLAPYLRAGDCVGLEGDLGAGKSVFARALIRACLNDENAEVPSPTFTLVQHYPTPSQDTIWHYDLYRLEDAEELIELGLDEALEHGICLIEWPQIAAEHLPKDRLMIHIALDADGQTRHWHFKGGSLWEERLQPLINL